MAKGVRKADIIHDELQEDITEATRAFRRKNGLKREEMGRLINLTGRSVANKECQTTSLWNLRDLLHLKEAGVVDFKIETRT